MCRFFVCLFLLMYSIESVATGGGSGGSVSSSSVPFLSPFINVLFIIFCGIIVKNKFK